MTFSNKRVQGSSSRAGRNPTTLLILISAWIATVGNAALWADLSKIGRLQSGADIWVALCLGIFTGATLVAITALLAWRRSIKPILIFLLIASALGLHFMLSYGVVIDNTMMLNVFQTDPSETRDLLNLRLFLTLFIVAGLPTIWLLRQRVQTLS